MTILAIDTSCDETSAAVCRGRRVLSNVISSQVRYHRKYGGVVPFLAQRLHRERIDAVVELALARAGLGWKEVEAVAVTQGPGLAPALEVGIQKAHELAGLHNLPLYAVNHMAGHVASCLAQTGGTPPPPPAYPALALLVSGGHTELVLLPGPALFQVIGQTLDDALGEAYDKVAKMLGLGYPGGRLVARLAESGNPEAYPLPVPMQNNPGLDLSYSGLKNAVRLLVLSLREGNGGLPLDAAQIADVCASFERVAQLAVLQKVEKALRLHPEVQSLLLAGGVAANTALRARLRPLCAAHGLRLRVPPTLRLCTDNAAMIGVAAAIGIENGQQPVTQIDRQPGLSL